MRTLCITATVVIALVEAAPALGSPITASSSAFAVVGALCPRPLDGSCTDPAGQQGFGNPAAAAVHVDLSGAGIQTTLTAAAAALPGNLHAAASATFNVAGPTPLWINARGQGTFIDLVTISFAPFNGSVGTLWVDYLLDGSISSSGLGHGFSEVAVVINDHADTSFTSQTSVVEYRPVRLWVLHGSNSVPLHIRSTVLSPVWPQHRCRIIRSSGNAAERDWSRFRKCRFQQHAGRGRNCCLRSGW